MNNTYQISQNGAIPRVGLSMLAPYIGQTVSIIGRVEQKSGGLLTLTSYDGIKVSVNVQNLEPFQIADVYEVIGVAQNANTIDGQNFIQYSSNFDLALESKVQKYTNGKYTEIFV